MIPITICSINNNLAQQVSANIKATIGVEHEIIVFDNKNANFGISKVYNLCAAQTKYSVLCFVHEDILFHTQGWGSIIVELLSNRAIGLLGVAGSVFQANVNSGWHIGAETSRLYHLQSVPATSNNFLKNLNPDQNLITDVVTLDGMWLCCREEVWSSNHFDETTFTGFHFYDLDFSLQVLRNYRVCVVYNVLREHASEGSFNSDWINDSFKFLNKWKRELPACAKSFTKKELTTLNLAACQKFTYKLMETQYNKIATLRFVFRCIKIDGKNKRNWLMLMHFLTSFKFLQKPKKRVKALFRNG